jgi:hypothetical protein
MGDEFNASKLIFIGGAPRSGTTLIQRVLACNSIVHGGPEFDHVPAIMRLRNAFQKSIDNGRISTYLTREQVDETFREFLLTAFRYVMKRNPEKQFLSEKTPSNADVFHELSTVFPDAKLVFVVRDPRAIIASMLEVGQRFRREGQRPPDFTRSVRRAIKYINSMYSKGHAQLKSNSPNFHVVFYEDFITAPAVAIRDLAIKLGLQFEEAMLRIEEKKTITSEFSAAEHLWYSKARLQEKIDEKSMTRWTSSLSRFQLYVISRRLNKFDGITDRYELERNRNPLFWVGDSLSTLALTTEQWAIQFGKRMLSKG